LGRVSNASKTPDGRIRSAVRRLLDAVDRALAAAREVEAARTALDRAASPPRRLRVVTGPNESESPDAS
jgi:hypothetical protein